MSLDGVRVGGVRWGMMKKMVEMAEMAEGLVGMVDMGEGAWVVEGSIYLALFPNCGQFEGCRKLKRNEICSTKYMKPLIWNSNAIWTAGITSLYISISLYVSYMIFHLILMAGKHGAYKALTNHQGNKLVVDDFTFCPELSPVGSLCRHLDMLYS